MSALLSLLLLSIVLGVNGALEPSLIIGAEVVAAEVRFGWGTAEPIETSAGHSFFPEVAVDPQGNAVAVWIQSDEIDFDNLWASRFVPGSGWGTAELLETNSGNATTPQVAVDAQGNAVAVWSQPDDAWDNIWASRFVPGSGWGTAELLETNPDEAIRPQVAVDAQGNAVAVWQHRDFTRGFNVWANRFVPGVGWGTAELLDAEVGSVFGQEIAVDSQGNAIAVWSRSSNIWANRFVPGVGWGTAELIDADAGSVWSGPEVAADPEGRAVAVWPQSNGTFISIWANRFVPGVGWGTAELIEADPGDAQNAQVAVDAQGNAVAVWEQRVARFNIWANRFVQGVGWGTAELIEHKATDARNAQVAVNPRGNAVAVWSQHEGPPSNIWANRFVPDVGWGTAELIETNAGDARYPKVAVDAQGIAVTVWRQEDDTHADIWANRFAEVPEVPGLVISPMVMSAGIGAAVAVAVWAFAAWLVLRSRGKREGQG